jgi:hypothetical protein
LFNWKVSAVALGTILVTAIAAVFSARYRRGFLQLWGMLLALACASAFLMFLPSLFFWQHLPKLEFVQFPWRWLVPLDVSLAFFVAASLRSATKQWLGWIAILIATGALGTAFVKDTWWDSEDIPVLANAIHSGQGYEGTDEYQPLGCDRYQLPGQPPASADSSDAPTPTLGPSLAIAVPKIGKIDLESGAITPLNNEELHLELWTAETKFLTTNTSQPVSLALRLINYPAWEIQEDGRVAHADSLPETAQLSAQVPAGKHPVNVHFQRTWDRSAGGVISIVSAFLLLGFASKSRQNRRI